MAADLHIHVFAEGELVEEDFARFFSHSLGSKWFNLDDDGDFFGEVNQANRDKIDKTEHIWIGEVSFLKAALFEDAETFIPSPVAQVTDLIGEDLPVIDAEFIEKVREALGASNATSYEVTSANDVVAFLESHKGKRAFTIAW